MTKEEVIALAQEAGLDPNARWEGVFIVTTGFVERFAALVAEHERERIIAANAPEIERINAHIKALEDAATAIRSRE